MKTYRYRIEGMSCDHCAQGLQNALNAIPGVSSTVSFSDKSVLVTADDTVSEEQCQAVITENDYQFTTLSE